MDKFLKIDSLPGLNQKEKNLYKIVTNNEIESIIQKLPKNKRWIHRGILPNFKEGLIQHRPTV